jgi:UDP-N-acetylglucosamine 2-epimerase (non-hydrolysing)
MKSVFIFVGTRPEAIKLIPVYQALKGSHGLRVTLVSTGQHREMLRSVLDFFDSPADMDFDIMRHNQSLGEVASAILSKTSRLLAREKPSLVVVQGDTTTCLAVSMAAFFLNIPVAHVEAGLRSHNFEAPFPEEANRTITSMLAQLHFAPTRRAAGVLKKEKVRGKVLLVGNTVIDCLLLAVARINITKKTELFPISRKVEGWKRLVLVTVHRRENFGEPFKRIGDALVALAKRFPETAFVYPVHPNPNVREEARRILGQVPNILLVDPLSYPEMVFLMMRSTVVLTDSGGIQEEAPTLGKPVIVLREVTERPEGIEAGAALLAGSNTRKILALTTKLLTDKQLYQKMAKVRNPYGDGKSAARIARAIIRWLK